MTKIALSTLTFYKYTPTFNLPLPKIGDQMKSTKDQIESYQTEVIINASAADAFHALSKALPEWWGAMDNPTSEVGDIFTVSWGKPWYQFEVIEYKPNAELTWQCVDANQIIGGLEGVEKEWVGSMLYWTITTIDKQAIKVSFKHEGLVPQIKCYNICSSAWEDFISIKLKQYLEEK